MNQPHLHDHDELDECVRALETVHAFLHGELPEAQADEVRHHLHACERCMESYQIEETITEMIRRSHKGSCASETFRARMRVLCYGPTP